MEDSAKEYKKNMSAHMQKGGKFKNWQMNAPFLMLYDFLAANSAYLIGLWLCFDCCFSGIPQEYLRAWMYFAPVYAIISIFVYHYFRLYQSIWRFAGYTELKSVLITIPILGLIHAFVITILFQRMPVPYYIIGIFIQSILILLVRFASRFIMLECENKSRAGKNATASRVMMIGAGSAGRLIVRDIHNAKEINECVHCIIDDDYNKWGRFIDGIPIVGGRDDILLNAEKYKIDKIYLAIPGVTPEIKRDILNICSQTQCEIKILPGVSELISVKATAESMKDVRVEDLLGREPVRVNMDEIYDFIKGKVILVTGGGGSIGSELCRQIARHSPKMLIVFDVYENNAHAISLELRDQYPLLNLVVLIGSVRDSRRINQVFQKYKPEVVYHAAAHKHVPMMEDSPCESIKNNVIGTYITAYAAMVNGCKRFVLISTDKAVNPTNIMGASKRLCEMIIQSFDRKIREGKYKQLPPLKIHGEPETLIDSNPQTEFVAVRFGNVLGSNGSVIPRFKEQIARGGPVTVTHPDIIRYFMTIPEASSLVLQAGTYADGGEIYVLDMGSPVRIDALARNLIRLSGFVPDVDIKITYTGLRAGEKLFEEKLMSEESMRTTPNSLIHISKPVLFDVDEFLQKLNGIMEDANQCEDSIIRETVAEVVTSYKHETNAS